MTDIITPKAGMIGLTHGKGFISSAIRVGQRMRFPAEYCKWNHAFIMINDEELIEMGGHGAQKRLLMASYHDTEHVIVDPGIEMDLEFAQYALDKHTGYGYSTIVSLGLSMLTGTALEFGVQSKMICSGLVAACSGIDKWRSDPSHVTPAEIALEFWKPTTISVPVAPGTNAEVKVKI